MQLFEFEAKLLPFNLWRVSHDSKTGSHRSRENGKQGAQPSILSMPVRVVILSTTPFPRRILCSQLHLGAGP
jgi:hypothetical protein